MCFIAKTTPIDCIDGKSDIKINCEAVELVQLVIQPSFNVNSFNSLWVDTHMHRHTQTHTHTDFPDKCSFKKPGVHRPRPATPGRAERY